MSKLAPWFRFFAVVLIGLGPLAAGYAWIKSQGELKVPPTLAAVIEPARAKKFGEAKRLLAEYLQAHPDDSRAHMMMAEFAIEEDKPDPALAIAQLDLVRETDPARQALVMFFKGKAFYLQGRYDKSEDCWTEALDLDPQVPEAGPAMINLLELQGRLDEAFRLGLKLHEVEPDARDKVRLLISIGRLDLDKPAPDSQTQLFEPTARSNPANMKICSIVGLSLIRDSKPDAGVEVLSKSLELHKDAPEAWDAWLTGLDEAGRPTELAAQLGALPDRFHDDPRFAKHRGQVALNEREWTKAAEAFEIARNYDPHDTVVLYRLSRALRLAGNDEQLASVVERINDHQKAAQELRGALDEALASKTLGLKPDPGLYHRMADIRERMGRPLEALAWHRLVLYDDPEDTLSLEAVSRLQR